MNKQKHKKHSLHHALRVEGREKLSGKALYTDDIKIPNMIYGITVRSPVARGILKDIVFKDDVNWSEFTIVLAKDIPGKNYISMIDADWQVLVDKKINHHGEAIALIAHPEKNKLHQALSSIFLDIETLPPVLSIEEAEQKKQVIWGENNLIKSYTIKKGDTSSVWEKAYKVIEATYRTEAQEHLYIEPNGMIAEYQAHSGVTVWGSLQCPYYVHKALYPIFDLKPEQVRVVQMETGGGFGGKEDFPSLLAAHCALLAYKANRPVKMIYTRAEDIAFTTKRHPSRSKVKMAVDEQGKMLALEIDFTLDGGAYTTLTPVVLSRGAIHAAGPYFCPNVLVHAKAYATNTFPHGAFRGFGAPQSIFAIERHMDVVAKSIGMCPIQFRRNNFLQVGQTTATGQKINELIDFNTLLDKALEKSQYYKKVEEYKKHNEHSPLKKGIGVATFMHGAGFTGSGEVFLGSLADVELREDGRVVAYASTVEMGQGKNTVFGQIIAQELNIPLQDVLVHRPDTKYVPDSGPTVASRTTMIVGKLLERGAQFIKEQLITSGLLATHYTADEFKHAAKEYVQKHGPLKRREKYQHPDHIFWDDKNYQGDAYATYAWAVYIADVQCDTLTFDSKVNHFTAVQEIGHVVNPVLAAGQIEGGVAQAIGYALYEKVRYKNGAIINNQMSNYIMPTSMDVPNIEVYFEEWNKKYGPSGAKGIGELPMDGPAPAVLNALEMALPPLTLNCIPMLPEDLFQLVLKEQLKQEQPQQEQ